MSFFPSYVQPFLMLAAHPFGTGFTEDTAAPASIGIVQWLIAQQAHVQQTLYQMAFNVGANTQTTLWFWLLCFLYGIIHAIGPGHGKAVLSAYLLAHGQRLKTSLILSSLAALLQGVIAIAIVGVIVFILHATSAHLQLADQWVELIAYCAIMALGAWLTIVRGIRLIQSLITPIHTHNGHDHHHGSCCGHHDVITAPAQASFSQKLGTIIVAGLRPCSGAILILAYTAAQGVFILGVIGVLLMSAGTAITTALVATLSVLARTWMMARLNNQSRWHMVAARLFEFAAAVFVLLLGALLFFNIPHIG